MIQTIKCDYCHGQNAVRLSFLGEYSWYNEITIDSSTGLSDQHEIYVCKDCGKVMLKKVGEALEYVEKVFDAEGVPLEIGDTVYCDDDPEPFKVVSFDDLEHVYLTLAKDPNGTLQYEIESSRLTHERPILDADGVPIKVGDTVWTIYDSRKRIISAVSAHGSKNYNVRTVDPVVEYEGGLWDFAKKVTHKRPDSWEKLEEDIYHLVTKGYLDRPDEDVKSIVSRAKKLTKKEEA